MGLFSPEISTKTLVPLCRQLATSYDAGIPLVQTLALTRNGMRDGKAKEVLRAMEQDVRDGATLAEAAGKQRRYLPPILTSLLASGEAGGRLDRMLRDLADYYEDRLAMSRRIMGMLAYPVIQLMFAWFLGTFAIGLIRNLDFSARDPFSLSSYIGQWLVFQGGALTAAALVFGGLVVLGRRGMLDRAQGFVASRVWPLSIVARRFALARFFRSFALLIQSGLPIQRCVEHAAAASDNAYIARDLERAIPPIMEGRSLVEAFGGVQVLTPSAREMLAVGEQSGNLEASLNKVADYHMAEANQAVEMATKVANVLIVLVVGLVVGYVVITFWTTYYGSMMDSF
ncbi:MAG: type II secretion system F family protein [Candidatus Hydrogenedentota bacterium]